MRVQTLRATPARLQMLLFVGIFFAQVDLYYRLIGALPVKAPNLFLFALAVVCAGTVLRAIVLRSARAEVGALYVAHLPVLLPLVGICFFGALSSLLPSAFWDEGSKNALFPLFDAATFALALLLPLPAAHRRAFRVYFLAAFVLSAGSVFADTIWPGTFSIVEFRAAGFVRNPNTAAFVLITFCCAIIDFRRLRVSDLLVLAITSVAVLATLSRGGLIMLVFVVACYAFFIARASRGHRFRLLGLAVGIGLLVTGVFHGVATLLEEARMFRLESTRLAMLLGRAPVVSSSDSRWELLRTSWDLVRERPLLGSGTAHTNTMVQGPHNIYLRQWIDSGLGGAICYVWLLAAGGVLFYRRGYRPGLVYTGVVAIQGMFSHNLLDERPFLAVYAVMLTLSYLNAGEDPDVRDRRTLAA